MDYDSAESGLSADELSYTVPNPKNNNMRHRWSMRWCPTGGTAYGDNCTTNCAQCPDLVSKSCRYPNQILVFKILL